MLRNRQGRNTYSQGINSHFALLLHLISVYNTLPPTLKPG